MTLPTGRRASVEEALARHDVTIALTPGQLLILVVGVWVVVRIVRGLRD
jgi:uncharacterized membrane protein